MGTPINLLIADDSTVFVEALSYALEIDRDIRIVGTAEDGQTAVEMVKLLNPDIITMDLHMPGLDGLQAIEQIMSTQPTPILVLTSDPNSRDDQFCFEALSRGALELLPKPQLFDATNAERRTLCERIRLLASIPIVYHPRQQRRPPKLSSMLPANKERGACVVAIAASTGGPATICEIIRTLPVDFPTAIIVVQHMAKGFSYHYASWLQRNCALTVCVARDKEKLLPGRVLIGPDGNHLVIDNEGRVRLRTAETYESLFCPSADLLFNSVAKRFKHRGIGVVLTGMGRDGAQGLLALRNAGGVTIAQDAESSVVDGMPKASRELNAATFIVGLSELAPLILRKAEEIVQATERKR